jgi:signal peptidase I
VGDSPQASSRPPSGPRPWLAALLTLVILGFGQLYAGRPKRGLAIAAAGFGVMTTALALSMVAPSAALRLLLVGRIPLTHLYTALDAFQVARRSEASFRLGRHGHRWTYAGVALGAVFVVSPLLRGGVRRYVARAYVYPSAAMQPAILAGDYLLAAPLRGGSISRGDPVVYSRADASEHIHRVIGLPGDTLEMRAKVVFVNGHPQREPYARSFDRLSDPSDPGMEWQRRYLARPDPEYRPTRDRWGPLVLPPESYFLLGDNRDNSQDSRYTGLVRREAITRRPVWIYLTRKPGRARLRWERFGLSIQ